MTTSATRFTFLDLIIFGSPKIDESVRGPMNLHMLSRFQKYKIPISVVTLINATILLAMFSADSSSGFCLIAFLWWLPVALYSGFMFWSGLKPIDLNTGRMPSGRFVKRAEIGSFILGLWWTGLMLTPVAETEAQQLTMIGVAMGMCCGVVGFTAPMVGVAARYMTAATVVQLLALLQHHTATAMTATLFGLALSIALLVSSRNFFQSTLELVVSRTETERAHDLLKQSLETSRHGFAIFTEGGERLVANTYHQNYFPDFVPTSADLGTKEISVKGSDWFIRSVSQSANRNFIVTHTNINLQKETQRSLLAAQETINDALAARSRFISRASTDLAGPLKYIMTLASAMSSSSRIEFSREEVRAHCDSIDKVARDLLDLVRDIEDYAEGEAGGTFSNEAPEDLRELLSPEQLWAAATWEKTTFDRIKVSIPHDLGVVMIDGPRFTSTVVKLLKRASMVSIDPVVLTCTPDDEGRIHVTIVDRGRPLSPAEVADFFEPYGDETRPGANQYVTRGLELALIKKYLNSQGAEITVRPLNKIGNAITITLPASATVGSRTDQRAAPALKDRKPAPRRAANA
ncbi:MAG TPA: HAMP domain-containing sensor histidine kinase [Hyphomonas sp.]|nr:HAMP domain-containing sensor histidine kinase [Hyphomonas sp.]HRX72727.1 HAMP domain-containing sensor histidine kinase [Hyphomonas sp.]